MNCCPTQCPLWSAGAYQTEVPWRPWSQEGEGASSLQRGSADKQGKVVTQLDLDLMADDYSDIHSPIQHYVDHGLYHSRNVNLKPLSEICLSVSGNNPLCGQSSSSRELPS